MAGGYTLVLGGARSGKSSFALRLADGAGRPVLFLATASAGDADMAARIERHRTERPPSWRTIEEPLDLVGAIAGRGDDFVIVDCLTMWVANQLFAGLDDDGVLACARNLSGVLAGDPAPGVVISNEVGMGIHPDSELGRRYRDLLGRVNGVFAAAARCSLLMVAGRALRLEDPADLCADAVPA